MPQINEDSRLRHSREHRLMPPALKRLKHFTALLTLGFLAFAPPGTLVFIVVLLVGLTGSPRLIIGGCIGLIASGAGLAIWARRTRRSSSGVHQPK